MENILKHLFYALGGIFYHSQAQLGNEIKAIIKYQSQYYNLLNRMYFLNGESACQLKDSV